MDDIQEIPIVQEKPSRRFAREVVIFGIASILAAMSPLVLMILLTKTRGVDDYGLWSLVATTVLLVSTFVTLGLPTAMLRFLPGKTAKGEAGEEFYSVFLFSLCAIVPFSLLVIVTAPLTAPLLFEDDTQIVRLTGGVALFNSLNILCSSYFRAFRQVGRYSFFMLVDVYAQVGLFAWFVAKGGGLQEMVAALLVSRAVVFVVMLLVIARQTGVCSPHFSKIREYLKFGLPAIPMTLSYWVVNSSDRFVIGSVLGASSVGVYSAAYGVGYTIYVIGMVFGTLLTPAVSRLYDEGRIDEVTKHLSYSLKYMLAILIPYVFGATVLREQVLRIISTTEISADGKDVVPLIALGSLFFCVGVVPGTVLMLVKRTRVTATAWVIAAVMNLGVNIVIVPHLELMGAAITTLLAFFLALGIMWHYASKEIRVPVEGLFIVKSLIASSVMTIVVWALHPHELQDTLVAIVVGVVVYAVALVLLRGFKKKEFKFFRDLVANR